MLDYELLESKLNEEARKILLLIKQDYYSYFGKKKKELIDNLINSEKIVVVDKGAFHYNDNTLAHGGRALGDGKIHFYPDSRNFDSLEDAFNKCKKILTHECFHYFIQPDNIKFSTVSELRMAHFYTEGLVEKESRKFYERHKDVISFEKANYGFNINFVNMIQHKLGASSYKTIFGENEYLKNIGQYSNEYDEILKRKKALLDKIINITNLFPAELHSKVYNRMRTMIVQDGDDKDVMEKIKQIVPLLAPDIDGPTDIDQ